MPSPSSLASPRAAIMMVFAAFGTSVGALAGSMAEITRDAGVGSQALGLAITAATLGTVTVMSSGGIIARHASNRMILLASLPAFALLTGILLVSTSLPVFFAAFFLLGITMGFTDLFMNAEGAAIEYALGRPIFSAFHGSVSLGLPVYAILASYLSAKTGTWATAICVVLPFALAWTMVYRLVPPRPLAFGRSARIAALPNKMPLLLLGLAGGLIMAGEMAAIMWSAKLLDEQAPSLAAIAGLGAAFFGLCNAAVRLPGDRLRARLGELPLMMGFLLVAAAGFAALGLSHNFALSVAAFATVGFGTALQIPCVFALAAAYVPANRAAGISFVSMIAGLPRTLAPWVFGWIAGVTGIGRAFGLYAGIMCLALLTIVMLRRRRAG